MPRINNPKPPKRAPKDAGRRVKKKPCAFCQHGVAHVDYKDLSQLRKYISDRGKIRGRRVSGNCAQHQRDVAEAIKTARELALLPYTQRTVTERRGGRGRDRDRDRRGPRIEDLDTSRRDSSDGEGDRDGDENVEVVAETDVTEDASEEVGA